MQIVANAIFTASVIFLTAISFSLIYSVTRFFHFAHAAVIAFAAYIGFVFAIWLKLPMFISLPIAVIAAGLLGWILNKIVYCPMRKQGATPLILLLSSLGLYIILQNGISLIFGDDTKILLQSVVVTSPNILGANVTYIQIVTICMAVIVLVVLAILLGKTKIGLSLRAVESDGELAEISGINLGSTLGWAFFLGSCMAGLSGLLVALDIGMTPTMGLPMLLMGVVATIVGGTGRVYGIAIASLFLAICQQITAWKWGSHWQEMVAFLILLIFLLLRPEGVMGKRLKKATV